MKYEAIIFDLDQTLIDTAKLENWRKKKDWESCKQNFNQTSVFPGVQQMFQQLQHKKKAIVTNSSIYYAEPILKHHDISYDVLVPFNSSGKNKPYPNQLLTCSEKLGVSPESCIYVGDDEIDIIAAKSAGMTAIAFASNQKNTVKLIPCMPDGIISNFAELLEYINLRENEQLQVQIRHYSEQTLQAKQSTNSNRYLRLLETTSGLGDANASYQFARLLYKNQKQLKGKHDYMHYFWKAAKQMLPEAIYALGYFFEKEGRREEATKFYRTGAYLENPRSQVRYSKEKVRQSSTDLKMEVISHLLKKAVQNEGEKAQTLYEKVQNIQEFEQGLKKLFSYDKSHATFYLQDYIPSQKEQDWFSQQIKQLKNVDSAVVNYFFEQLNVMPQKDIVFAYVPSSDKDKTMTGIRKIAIYLAGKMGADGTSCLVRTVTKEKSSQGGERSRDIHFQTMKVMNHEILAQKHVLLLDDVTTSGNALSASEQMLLDAGAFHVTKLALGRTKS